MGAGQVKRAEKGYRAAMGGIVALLMAAGVVLSRRPVAEGIVSIFSTDPDVIAMAADYFGLMAMWTWNNGVLDCTASLFRACGHTGVTMVNDIARIWVFRFATLFVCQRLLGLGVESIWYSVVISNGLAALMMFVLYLTGMWKKNKIKV